MRSFELMNTMCCPDDDDDHDDVDVDGDVMPLGGASRWFCNPQLSFAGMGYAGTSFSSLPSTPLWHRPRCRSRSVIWAQCTYCTVQLYLDPVVSISKQHCMRTHLARRVSGLQPGQHSYSAFPRRRQQHREALNGWHNFFFCTVVDWASSCMPYE